MLASALKLETKGIYPLKGSKTAYTIIKKEFDLKGSKLKVLSQFDCMLIDAGLKQG